VDGSYASTTPQTVNGVLAEVRFTALQGCQTGLYLESAAPDYNLNDVWFDDIVYGD